MMISQAMTLRGRLRSLDGAQTVILACMAAVTIFVLWASLAMVDEVTRGQGRVMPSSKMQMVQSAEPATIKEILVRSGQAVRKGQLLVRLDDTQLAAEAGQLETENRLLSARADRLSGEAAGEQLDCSPAVGGVLSEACSEEARLQAVRQSALDSRLTGLQAAIEQRRRELSEAQATVASLQGSVALAQRQVDMIEPLAAKHIVPETELLSARRELVELQGRLAAAREGVSRTGAGVREAMAQASEANFQFRQDALNERSQLKTRIAVNSQSLRGAENRVQRAELRSPVDGVVNDVQVTTIGGFVQPGQKIMQVVPLGDKLLVEARVRPSDIAFIKVDDRANVKVTAYDFSVYGGLAGRVVQISADSIYDEVAKEAYFSVVVETDRAYLLSGSRKLPITPGMICDVEIITGRKSILSYLLKPVLKAQRESLQER